MTEGCVRIGLWTGQAAGWRRSRGEAGTVEAWVMEFLGDPTDHVIRATAYDEWRATAGDGEPVLLDVSTVEIAMTPADLEQVEAIGASTLVVGPGARAAWVLPEP